MSECDHPPLVEVIEPSELVRAFGPTAAKHIPPAPGYAQLRNDSGEGVYLSRLACGHFSMGSPTTVKAAMEAAEAAAWQEKPEPVQVQRRKSPVGPPMSGDALRQAFEDARAGREVDAAEVARLEASIRLEEVAEQGRQERAEAERIEQAEAARTALEGPQRQKLELSRLIVQDQLDATFQALQKLLDVVDDDAAVHEAVLAALTAGGDFSAGEVRTTNGYVTTTTVGGEEFKMHLKAEYILTLLWTLQASRRHQNSSVGVGGRNLMKELPPLTQGGPRITETPG